MRVDAKRQVVLDCDPGHDDAMAIMIGYHSDLLDLKAVTTVAGNAGVQNAYRNAWIFSRFFGMNDLPIFRGMERPLVFRFDVSTGPIHGVTGMDGYDFPATEVPESDTHAVDFLRRALAEQQLTIVATGPLTNLATVLSVSPEVRKNIKRIVIMGGCIGLGNRSPAAEFNIWADPEAAFIVADAGLPLEVVPLEVTHKAMFTLDHCAELERSGSEKALCVSRLMRFAIDRHRRAYGTTGYPVHDACAMAIAEEPAIGTSREVHMEIDLSHGPCHGRTVFDLNARLGKKPNVLLVTDIEGEKVVDRIMELALR
jgi:inosine-uridine nucleoside N-ribohydrolase